MDESTKNITGDVLKKLLQYYSGKIQTNIPMSNRDLGNTNMELRHFAILSLLNARPKRHWWWKNK